MSHMTSVGVRALQQNASSVISRVEAGETIDITDRGRLVARMVPIRSGSRIQELLDAGRLRRATRNVLDVARPVDLPTGSKSLGETLAEMRADER